MNMMGGMMAFGWLGTALVLVLLVAAIVALVRLLNPDVKVAEGSGLNILLAVFAVIGVLGLLALIGGVAMHWSMRGMMG
jgi:hypothetical protein